MAEEKRETHHARITLGRYELDLTRTDLRNGDVQVTQALMQALQAGVFTVTDVQSQEPVTLTFNPPRTLSGLAPFFERHNLRPNDRLILTLTPSGGLLDMYRRPAPVRAQRPESVQERADESAAPENGARGSSGRGWGTGSSVVERLTAYGSSLPDRERAAAVRAAGEREARIGRVRVSRLEQQDRVISDAPPTPTSRNEPAATRPATRPPAPAKDHVRLERTPAGEPSVTRRQAPDVRQGASNESVADRVRRRLQEPGVPAIIRAVQMAEQLELDPVLVEQALATMAREDDSGVDMISSGVFRHSVLTRSS